VIFQHNTVADTGLPTPKFGLDSFSRLGLTSELKRDIRKQLGVQIGTFRWKHHLQL